MAGNGYERQLEQLEKTITGTHQPATNVVTGQPSRPIDFERGDTTDDVVARVDAAAELCREVGRYASDHGRYLDEISAAFAERLQAMTKEYAANMLAAEERKMAELRRILGKIAG